MPYEKLIVTPMTNNALFPIKLLGAERIDGFLIARVPTLIR